jgi:hypothetical protein
MKSPLKQKRAPAKSALRKLRLRIAYRIAAVHAKMFEAPYWFFERWRGQVADRIENEGSARRHEQDP